VMVTWKYRHGESTRGATNKSESTNDESYFMLSQQTPQKTPTYQFRWLNLLRYGRIVIGRVEFVVRFSHNRVGCWSGHVSRSDCRCSPVPF
jgi:hypothetical protein